MAFQNESFETMFELNKPLNDHSDQILEMMKDAAREHKDAPTLPGVTTESRTGGDSFQNDLFLSPEDLREVIQKAHEAEAARDAEGFPPRLEGGEDGDDFPPKMENDAIRRACEEARRQVEDAQARLEKALETGVGVVAAQNRLTEAMQWQFKMEQKASEG